MLKRMGAKQDRCQVPSKTDARYVREASGASPFREETSPICTGTGGGGRRRNREKWMKQGGGGREGYVRWKGNVWKVEG